VLSGEPRRGPARAGTAVLALGLLFAARPAGAEDGVPAARPAAEPVDATSWRDREGRLRSLYLPKFVPAPDLLSDALALGLGDVDLALDPLRGRLVLAGDDGPIREAREALDWLDVPPPQALVRVAIVETLRRKAQETGGHFLYDRSAPDGAPDTFFRGVRTDFEPESWLRSQLLGVPFEGASVAFGRSSAEPPLSGTIHEVLRGLARSGWAEFLAEPSLVCPEGVVASIEASVSVPSTTIERTPTESRRGIVEEKAGVRLEVLVEHVGAGQVTLRLRPWVRQVVASDSELGPPGAPVLAVREVDTRLTIADGDTVLVGALEHLRRSRGRSGPPGIPGLVGLDPLIAAVASDCDHSELLFAVSVRILTPGRAPEGTLPPGEAERLLRRGTRARVICR
jgi:type II secretory pathway component GspD/PulD (secretin)